MRAPFSVHGVIPAAASIWAKNSVPLVRARTLSLTIRLYFEASMDADATVYVYYSPDGDNWDTIQLTSWAIAYTASTTKQVTKIIDVPEHGYVWFKITNGSQSYTITKVKMWYTIQSWPEVGEEIVEQILRKALKRQRQEETGQRV